MPAVDLSSFQNHWIISGEIELITPLRIGGGQNAAQHSIATSPVIQRIDPKTGLALPFIPGSSLKGVLRSTLERLIRTYNPDEACISIGTLERGDKKLCGECQICHLFGSMAGGSKIKVRDAEVVDDNSMKMAAGLLKEYPHCATRFKESGGKYIVKMGRNNMPKTLLRTEETAPAGSVFHFEISVDNGDEREIGLLLLALTELREKRAHLGGSATRGYGFVRIDTGILRVSKMELGDPDYLHSEISPHICIQAALDYLEDIKSGDQPTGEGDRSFDRYYAPHITVGGIQAGFYTIEIKATANKPFVMSGIDETTVTGSGGMPIIPGSTLKGYIRHKMVKDKQPVKYIDELLGDTQAHRGRIFCSDGEPETHIHATDSIPERTDISFHLILDNVSESECEFILGEIFPKDRELLITGNTSAFGQGNRDRSGGPQKNVITIKHRKASAFRFHSYPGQIKTIWKMNEET